MTTNHTRLYCCLLTCVVIAVLIPKCQGLKRSASRALRNVRSRRALGQQCITDSDCYDPNAECNTYSGLCSCKNGFVDNHSRDVIGRRCQANLGSSCRISSDCHDYFAECTQSTCRCQDGKIFSRGRCLNVCGQIDIRNQVSDLTRLENCSVIEGHLHIVLIDYANVGDYDDYSFPDLVEVTDYLMLYRVKGLKSLAKLFPNLAVIRGQNLQIGCALIVYEMPDMVDLGLVSLTAMPRGSIRIEKNSKLCYIETVDWVRIATGVPMEDHVFKYNRDIKECVNRCPEGCKKTMGPKEVIPRCWSIEHCQKNLGCDYCGPDKFCNETTNQCCDNNCIGGCDGTEATQCTACRKVVDFSDPNKPRCAARCSAGYFEFKQRRCLSMGECLNFTFYKDDSGKKPMLKLVIPSERTSPGECVLNCGEGFRDDPTNTSKCIPCRGKCPKVCFSFYVDRVEEAQQLKGCTQISGDLEIGILHGSQVGKELDENLASVEEVTGSVIIRRSYPLLSLHFLKNLKVIGGKTLFRDRYSLVVVDNLNLQELFLEDVAKNLVLKNGTVLFQHNRKLCYKKILKFVDQIGFKGQTDPNDISPNTNGDQMPCEVSELNVTILEVSPRMAILLWTTFKTTDPRHIISYAIRYKEAPTKNVSIYASRDACSDDGWKVMDVEPKKDGGATALMNDLIAGLKPWTQYALYVETQTINRAAEQAISKIVYFRTAADVPLSPTNLLIRAEHPNELHVTWGPPIKPNGNITHYEVYWQRRNLDPNEYELRDYCAHPLSSSISIEETEEQRVTEEDEYEGEDGQMCQCKKSKKELEKEKNEREMEIFFQNALQNEVFMKRLDKPAATTLSPGMLNRSREIRSILSDDRQGQGHEKQKYTYIPTNGKALNLPQPGPGAADIAKTALVDPSSQTGAAVNSSKFNLTQNVRDRMQKENPYYKAVVFDTLELIIPNLGYFEDYNVEVIACQERDPRDPNKAVLCSNKALGVARTLPDNHADAINSSTIEITNVKNTTRAVYIKWKDPQMPNGLVLTYEIEYMKANINNVKAILICLTYKEYRDKGKYGHEFDNLEPGNYTFRIRANSLASNGSWSEFLSFTIPDPEADKVKTEVFVAAIVSGLVIVILLTIGVVWIVAKRRFEKDAHTIFSTNPEYPLLVYEPDEWEVEREKCTLLTELGQGSFGMVYEGIISDLVTGKEVTRVAIKTINNDSSDHERYKFLQEASIMKMFQCNHVVRLVGVVSKGQPALVLMELMPFGDLKNYLRQHRPDEDDNNGKSLPTLRQIMQIAGEIADGMAYLADKKFVHRDLAARNCMVGEDLTVKIGDFGMTRDIYETDYYRKGNRGLLPVRWMGPESLKDGVFTSMSDVWSYGVVLWEMATLAAQPYQGLSNEEVLRYVISGKVMDTPERCPPKLFDLMVKCWRYRPKQRPTFKEIIEILLPDLDKRFKDLSYFFSEENAKYEESKLQSASNHYRPAEDEMEDIEDDDAIHCPMNDYVDEANLPMLGVGASNGHSVELQDIFSNNGSYPKYPTHKHVGSAEPCDCMYSRDTDEGAAAPPIDFNNRPSVCSSPNNSAIGGSSDGSKDSSKSSNSSYQRLNGLSVANGHVPVSLRTTPC